MLYTKASFKGGVFMSSQLEKLDFLKRQVNKGRAIYIYINDKKSAYAFDSSITPYVNVEGLCENIRGWDSKTIRLSSFEGFGCDNDSTLIHELASSLGLKSIADYLKVPTELSNCDGLKKALARDSVLTIEKYNDEMYYSSVINLDKGETEPYVRQGEATGETIEHALVKTAKMYNIVKNKESIERLKNEILQPLDSNEFKKE